MSRNLLFFGHSVYTQSLFIIVDTIFS